MFRRMNMPDRFPPLAPQEIQRFKPMAIARALPAPSLPLLEMLIFGVLVVLIRLY